MDQKYIIFIQSSQIWRCITIFLIYCKTDGEIFRAVDSVEEKEDGSLLTYVNGQEILYDASCNSGYVELSGELLELYDYKKWQMYDGKTILPYESGEYE